MNEPDDSYPVLAHKVVMGREWRVALFKVAAYWISRQTLQPVFLGTDFKKGVLSLPDSNC
jgi:hypothetical protein